MDYLLAIEDYWVLAGCRELLWPVQAIRVTLAFGGFPAVVVCSTLMFTLESFSLSMEVIESGQKHDMTEKKA